MDSCVFVLSLHEPRQGSGSSGRAALLCSHMSSIRGRVSSAVSSTQWCHVGVGDVMWPAVTVAWRGINSVSLSILLLFPVVECNWSLLIAGAARRNSSADWLILMGCELCPFIAVVPWVVVLFLVECDGYFALCGFYFSLSFFPYSSSVCSGVYFVFWRFQRLCFVYVNIFLFI